jgi:hypothetical protein
MVRYADETILLSGISAVRVSGSVMAKHYDSKGPLESPQSISCPDHPLLHTWESPNECSGVLFSSGVEDSITLPTTDFLCQNRNSPTSTVSTTLRHGH